MAAVKAGTVSKFQSLPSSSTVSVQQIILAAAFFAVFVFLCIQSVSQKESFLLRSDRHTSLWFDQPLSGSGGERHSLLDVGRMPCTFFITLTPSFSQN